jgi:hypothetical protein
LPWISAEGQNISHSIRGVLTEVNVLKGLDNCTGIVQSDLFELLDLHGIQLLNGLDLETGLNAKVSNELGCQGIVTVWTYGQHLNGAIQLDVKRINCALLFVTVEEFEQPSARNETFVLGNLTKASIW